MKKNKFNFKDFKNSIMVSMGSIESYKNQIDDMIIKGKDNAVVISSACNRLLNYLSHYEICLIDAHVDYSYIQEELSLIISRCGDIDD